VCALYKGREAPAPACVQEAGQTIVIPDGWYHGTCNNASWTVGWGGQNRRIGFPTEHVVCPADGAEERLVMAHGDARLAPRDLCE